MAALDRFEAKFSKSGSDCWLWKAAIYPNSGYGMFHLHPGKESPTTAHRASWMFYMGPIPKGFFVLHKCDVRTCVNPEHLFLGTQHDNIQDMISKGRQMRQAKHTHCTHGHEFTQTNTFIKINGTQGCRRCASDTSLRYKGRNLDAVRKYQRERARNIRKLQREEYR